MYLSLENLTAIIRTGQPIPVELLSLVNFVTFSNNSIRMVNVSTGFSECCSQSPILLDLFNFSDPSICFAVALPPLETF